VRACVCACVCVCVQMDLNNYQPKAMIDAGACVCVLWVGRRVLMRVALNNYQPKAMIDAGACVCMCVCYGWVGGY